MQCVMDESSSGGALVQALSAAATPDGSYETLGTDGGGSGSDGSRGEAGDGRGGGSSSSDDDYVSRRDLFISIAIITSAVIITGLVLVWLAIKIYGCWKRREEAERFARDSARLSSQPSARNAAPAAAVPQLALGREEKHDTMVLQC